jgi:hypothetical protein
MCWLRARPPVAAAVAVLLALTSCARHSEVSLSGIDPTVSFASVLTAREQVEVARHRLASSPDPTSQRAARLEFEGVFRRYQKELARFLTTALNEFPTAPEARQGLDLYARAAIEIADQINAHDGDPEAALRGLNDARRYFEAIGAQPPPELLASVAKVRAALHRPAGEGDRMASPP